MRHLREPITDRRWLPAPVRLPRRVARIAVAVATWLPLIALLVSFGWRRPPLWFGPGRTWIVWLAHVLWFAAGAILVWYRTRWRQTVARLDRGALLCANCGYDLAHGISGACPECGTRYEADGLRAYWLEVLARRDQSVRTARRCLAQVALFGIVFATIALSSMLKNTSSIGEFPLRLVRLLIVFLPAAHMLFAIRLWTADERKTL